MRQVEGIAVCCCGFLRQVNLRYNFHSEDVGEASALAKESRQRSPEKRGLGGLQSYARAYSIIVIPPITSTISRLLLQQLYHDVRSSRPWGGSFRLSKTLLPHILIRNPWRCITLDECHFPPNPAVRLPTVAPHVRSSALRDHQAKPDLPSRVCSHV